MQIYVNGIFTFKGRRNKQKTEKSCRAMNIVKAQVKIGSKIYCYAHLTIFVHFMYIIIF